MERTFESAELAKVRTGFGGCRSGFPFPTDEEKGKTKKSFAFVGIQKKKK
jgi:hypothetical protein